MILCLNLWSSKARYRTIRTLQPLTDQHGLAECASSVVSTLSTFDPLVKLEKDAGIYENDFENRFQEDVWDTILSNYAVFPSWSDMRWNIPQYGRALALDMSIVQALAASTLSQRSREIARSPVPYQHPTSTIHINYVHHRLDRLRGLQFAVNFNQRGAGSNASRFNLLVENSLNKVNCLMSKRVSVVSPPIYILLPYSEREHRLRLFLQNFAELYTQHDDNVILIISILRDRRHDHLAVRSIKDEVFRNDYATVSDKVWIHENDGDTNHQFSRGVALREAAKLVPDPTSVLFQCDVDMIILPTFFDRCKHNTVLDSQVYYPVFYSLYPYANAHPSIAERNGFWRKTSFGMVCIRKGDFDSVGAFDDAEIRFQGWGSEDVYQYEKIRNTSNLVAFRAVDPSLLHRWHTKHCDRASGAYTECMKTNFVTMGDPIRIGPALLESITDVDALFARLQES
ncbi:Glycosyltransferase, family GT7 [Chondrus crispus]|uniref:Glycosyltransferase, family GT7 n=1 Tax=Chondrus crispus TaxID=2769 RepID=R7QCU9_CHOCR|nr:Glycosyltransferase, family GT7 [Chondrus crispus]CDF35894.1 Glycosyltransferase, family GT7 [Chondrus crispus]|eukprot:XP_005715713.1 Glycosyltransferase, family GT7 [Chondrus crispus]